MRNIRNNLWEHTIILLSILSLISCENEENGHTPNIRKIYSAPAQNHDPYTPPVIVIPGVLGSNLVDKDTGQSAWGVFYGDYLSPSTPAGIQALALRPQSLPLSEYETPLIPDGVMKSFEYKVLGLTIEANAYLHIMQTLGVGGFRDEALYPLSPDYGDKHFTCFQFAYDWRLSNATNAKKLHEFILQKKKYVSKETEKRYGIQLNDIKFNIVSHSMGGLLSRYYARYGAQPLPKEGLPELDWSGAEHINHLFLLSVPNQGSVVSLKDAILGKEIPNKLIKKAVGIPVDQYPPELIGTYPSIYEMFPRERHFGLVNENWEKLDLLSIELWKKQKWGLAGGDLKILRKIIGEDKTDGELKEIALSHLEKCLKNAQQFHEALDLPAKTKPAHMKISLYIGDSYSTTAQLKLKENGDLIPSIYKPGDETVIRSSSLADENVIYDDKPKLRSPIPFDDAHFIFKKHMAITEDAHFLDSVLFELLQR